MKVWVLTGDKKETAINISKSCRHITSQMELLEPSGDSPEAMSGALRAQAKKMRASPEHRHFAYVIEGRTLARLFEHKLEAELREVCMRCEAVLCCRMTPAQKAQVSYNYLFQL